ncbi:hypothetical protein M0812_05011 [Anaeramoeba flamelloides]|uniref:Alpha-type protein kinase domain-containing protein n=1 Tax=Anaeramoeba flamelloides TaxID=1746091 RepID=A0AAV8AD24_9EUKA|nr:hypothetical protein M0812_05011 [Anaeramoeba flamelloides]
MNKKRLEIESKRNEISQQVLKASIQNFTRIKQELENLKSKLKEKKNPLQKILPNEKLKGLLEKKMKIKKKLKEMNRYENEIILPSWGSDQKAHRICIVLDWEKEEERRKFNNNIVNKIQFLLCYLDPMVKLKVSIVTNTESNPFHELNFESLQKNKLINLYQEMKPTNKYSNITKKNNAQQQKMMSKKKCSQFILHFLSNVIEMNKQNERILRNNQVYCYNNYIHYFKIHTQAKEQNTKIQNMNNFGLHNYYVQLDSQKYPNKDSNSEYQIVNWIIQELCKKKNTCLQPNKYDELKKLKPYPSLIKNPNWNKEEEVQIITHAGLDMDKIFTNVNNHKEFTFTESKVKIYRQALMQKEKYDAFPFADIQVSIPLVAKFYHELLQENLCQYLDYIYAEAVLKSYIKNFNQLISNKFKQTVQVSPKILYSFPNREKDRFYIVEPFYPNDNAFSKYVPEEDKLLNAFSHYVLSKSNKQLCIEISSTIQNKIKRYKLHSKPYFFSRLDSGENKIYYLISNHRCNKICKKLKLKKL